MLLKYVLILLGLGSCCNVCLVNANHHKGYPDVRASGNKGLFYSNSFVLTRGQQKHLYHVDGDTVVKSTSMVGDVADAFFNDTCDEDYYLTDKDVFCFTLFQDTGLITDPLVVANVATYTSDNTWTFATLRVNQKEDGEPTVGAFYSKGDYVFVYVIYRSGGSDDNYRYYPDADSHFLCIFTRQGDHWWLRQQVNIDSMIEEDFDYNALLQFSLFQNELVIGIPMVAKEQEEDDLVFHHDLPGKVYTYTLNSDASITLKNVLVPRLPKQKPVKGKRRRTDSGTWTHDIMFGGGVALKNGMLVVLSGHFQLKGYCKMTIYSRKKPNKPWNEQATASFKVTDLSYWNAPPWYPRWNISDYTPIAGNNRCIGKVFINNSLDRIFYIPDYNYREYKVDSAEIVLLQKFGSEWIPNVIVDELIGVTENEKLILKRGESLLAHDV